MRPGREQRSSRGVTLVLARVIRTWLNWFAVAVVVTGTGLLTFGGTAGPFWRGATILAAGVPFVVALYCGSAPAGASAWFAAASSALGFAVFALFGAVASLNIGGTVALLPFFAAGACLCAWNAMAFVWPRTKKTNSPQ